MPPKPFGSIFIVDKTQTVVLRFNPTGQVFATTNKAWKYFLKKYCSEITNIPVSGGKSYPSKGGPTELGISEAESIRRLFRD
jgi:hypothetical protein